jgi:hypothetical protein
VIQIEQGSFYAKVEDGFATELTTSDSVVVGLVLNNDGSDDDGATVSFVLSDGRDGGESISVPPMSQAYSSWTIGPLHAGGYNCQATVTAGDGSHIGQEEIYFQVADAEAGAGGDAPSSGGSSTAPESAHNPQDYRLDVSQITMQTEGGQIVHREDEAFATERVFYFAEVVNNAAGFLGPFEVHFMVDGQQVGWGGMSHQGLTFGESFWAEGYTDPLRVGAHTLAIKIESFEPELFASSESEYELNVLPPRSRGSVADGDEDELAGWAVRDVVLSIKDYEGGMVDGDIYVEINDPRHRVAYRAVVEQGSVNFAEQTRAPEHGGSFVLTVTTSGGRTLSGGGAFDDGEGPIVKTYVEEKRIETHTFQTEEQWQAMIGTTLSAGVDIKIFSFGAEVTGEYTWGETITQGREYEIWIAQSKLTDQENESARNR